ncbi:LysR family transcriptional regulator [Paraburkholderia sp. J12]|uniref:LysR family transcriptional regulator n=1 Tax=Paraburkholderia sp. J12 TaxID=2805432 RepID=UPI002ABE576B|nr:LysR family transcriptional regulator [Paraburkholderia sp. J12]
MKDILSLRLYTRVARLGSFSAAAREWGMSQSQVSRIVADLETELGVRLLSRTTRAVVPTEAGAEFLARLDAILAALDDAQQSIREGADLRGTLRMSMPASIAVREVIPRLAPFAVQHPDLRIQMLVGDRPRDFVKEAVDVAFRLGRLGDSSATARLITTIPRFVIASPRYVAQHGAPATPEALNAHRIVGGPAADVSSAWIFSRGEEEVSLDLEPHFWVNENEGAVAAAVAGLGITSTSEWACRRELDDGSLVRLLADWTLPGIPMHAWFPMGRATRAAARAVVEHLLADFGRSPAGG